MKKQAAERNLIKARKESQKVLHEFQKVQQDTLDELMRAAEQEQELEKRSTDSLKADAKKLANLQKELALLKAKEQAKGDELFYFKQNMTKN